MLALQVQEGGELRSLETWRANRLCEPVGALRRLAQLLLDHADAFKRCLDVRTRLRPGLATCSLRTIARGRRLGAQMS